MSNSNKIIPDPAILRDAWERIAPRLEVQFNGCWMLNNTISQRERHYPLIMVRGFSEYAYRIAYRIYKGALSDNQSVRHTCHRPRCCNPAHLTLHSQVIKRTCLAQADILPIYLSDEPRDILAKRYGVDPQTITRIRVAKHSLTAHLPPRKFNGTLHWTAERRAKVRASLLARTEPRKSRAPYTRPNLAGEKHPMAKLSDSDAVAIFHSIETTATLAAHYGIAKSTIRNIRAGRHGATKHLLKAVKVR